MRRLLLRLRLKPMRFAAPVLLWLVAGPGAALAQAPASPPPVHADQYQSLTAVLVSLGELKPADLIEVSRLLSDRRDQINWLIDRAALASDAKTVTEFAQRITDRLKGFGDDAALDANLIKDWEQRLARLALKFAPVALADIL